MRASFVVDGNKRTLNKTHASTFRFTSTNKSIATVNKYGTVKGIKAGTCKVYIQALNGKKATVYVKVVK